MDKSAIISECQRYRYQLVRCWEPAGSTCCFVMLNPSTADHEQDDPTIRRCIAFAQRWGHGRLVVVNLFAVRSPSPTVLARTPYPVGPENDQHILAEAQTSELVVCAWGSNAHAASRARAVKALIQQLTQPFHLGLTVDGSPKHPLARGKHRIADDQQPVAW